MDFGWDWTFHELASPLPLPVAFKVMWHVACVQKYEWTPKICESVGIGRDRILSSGKISRTWTMPKCLPCPWHISIVLFFLAQGQWLKGVAYAENSSTCSASWQRQFWSSGLGIVLKGYLRQNMGWERLENNMTICGHFHGLWCTQYKAYSM